MPQKEKYRLQTLFDMRQSAKKDAEDAYAAEQKKVAIEKKKLDSLTEDLAQKVKLREQRRVEYAQEAAQGKSNIDKIQIQGRHIEGLKEKEELVKQDISKQEIVLKEAQKIAEEKLQEMLKATQEFKALEKHKEKWAEEVKKELERKEEEASEDISQSQYFGRLKEEE